MGAPKLQNVKMQEPSLVQTSVMFPEQNFILQVRPADDPSVIFDWCAKNREFLASAFLEYGGVVFRGFKMKPSDFRKLGDIISQYPAMRYVGGGGPRTNFGEGLYLSTTIDKNVILPQHHEMSYFPKWPMKIMFFCETPSTTGGETSIVSTRTFMKAIDPKIVKNFSKRKVRYVRNYVPGINSTWQASFDTDDKSVAEDFCRKNGLEFEWRGDQLRTVNVAQGTAVHPETGEMLWHNHAHIYNFYCGKPGVPTPTLELTKDAYPPEYREKMLKMHHLDLPTNTYYGDGTIFESEVIQEISDLLEEKKVGFIWEQGDMMVLDNMLAFHGRNPYEGDQRKILTMLKEPHGEFGK